MLEANRNCHLGTEYAIVLLRLCFFLWALGQKILLVHHIVDNPGDSMRIRQFRFPLQVLPTATEVSQHKEGTP